MKRIRKLRWGILGAARIARSYTAAIRESCNGELASVAARDPARAQSFAAEHGIPRAAASYEALLEDPRIDAVYIALPNALHAEWSTRALQAGKHVLCEKPLATSAREAEQMREAADASGRVLAEAIMYRLHPVNIEAIRLLRSGTIGELVAADAVFHAPVGADDPIRFSAPLGGGALLDLGVYCVSLLRWASGEEPALVHGARNMHPGGVDSASAGVMHFPSGALGTFACAYGTPFACRYELVGTKGRIVCDGGPLCAWPGGTFTIQHYPDRGDPVVRQIPPADHYRLTAEAFADAAGDVTPMPWNLDESIANLRVLDCLRDRQSRFPQSRPWRARQSPRLRLR